MLKREGERLAVSYNGETLREIPSIYVKQIIFFGASTLTMGAIDLLLEKNIEAAFISAKGRFRGRLSPAMTGRGDLRYAQYLARGKPFVRLGLAKKFIEAKILNQIAFLAGQKQAKISNHALSSMAKRHRKIGNIKNLDAIRLAEGRTAGLYFKLLSKLVPSSWKFKGRSIRPPQDRFNALLSLGYSLLFNHACSAVQSAGLDPYGGYLHDFRSGHPALASDMMEEFRCIMVDSFVVTMINRNVIMKKHFNENPDVMLNEEGIAVFFKEFAAWMETKFYDCCNEENRSFRKALTEQALSLARALEKNPAEYKPFIWEERTCSS